LVTCPPDTLELFCWCFECVWRGMASNNYYYSKDWKSVLEPCSSVRVKQGMEGQVSDKGTTTEIFFCPSLLYYVLMEWNVLLSLCTCWVCNNQTRTCVLQGLLPLWWIE
jgi:hypothetical protein